MTTTPTFWKTTTKATDNVANGGAATAGEQYDAIVPLANGGFLIVWTDNRSQQAQVFDAEGEVVTTHEIVPYWPLNIFGYDTSVVFTTLANGDIAMVFDGFNGAGYDQYKLAIFSNSGELKSLQPMNTILVDGPNEKTDVTISALADGGFVVGFKELESSFGFLAMKRFGADGTEQTLTGPPVILEGDVYTAETTTNEVRSAREINLTDKGLIEGLTGGGFVSVWVEGNTANTIAVRIFGADGMPIDTPNNVIPGTEDYEFNIEENASNIQQLQAEALSGGGFVVTWTATGADAWQKNFYAVISADGTIIKGATAVQPEDSAGTSEDPLQVASFTAGLRHAIALEDGGFLIVREDRYLGGAESSNELIFERFDASGNSLSGPVFLASVSSATQITAPNVLQLKDGTLLFAWSNPSAPGDYVAVRYDLDGNQIGEEFAPITASAQSVRSPTLVLLEDGRVAVSLDDSTGETHFSILDPRGSVIVGDSSDETITSRKDGATVKGLGGDDILLGQQAVDTLKGGNGADYLSGGKRADKLFGGNGNDELFGGKGKDKIFGGKGDDKLFGGKGNDWLKGNGGKDNFVFAKNEGRNKIADFQNGKDKIDLTAFNFSSKSAAIAKFTELGGPNNDKLKFKAAGTEIIIKGIDLKDLGGSDLII